MPARLSACLSIALAAAAGASAQTGDPVTVYRCVDPRGHVTLGDVPCDKGSAEEV